MKIPFLLGRIAFGGFFLYSGINHFLQRKNLTQYAALKGVPAADAAVPATGALLTLGGASLLLGVKPKLGALALIGFLAGASPMMHDFWKSQDPSQRQQEMIQFMKNLALLGGALALMGVDEPWPVSAPVAQPSRLQQMKRAMRRSIAA